MAKKKVTTKKKVGNTATVNQQEAMIMALQELQQAEGWAIVVNNFKANIAYLEDIILDKVDREGVEIDEMEVDKFRDKREIMKDLIKTPETFINQLTQSPEVGVDDLDPYHTDARESYNADLAEQAESESSFLDVSPET